MISLVFCPSFIKSSGVKIFNVTGNLSSPKGHDFSKLAYTDFYVPTSSSTSPQVSTITINGAYMYHETILDKATPSGYNLNYRGGSNSFYIEGPFELKFYCYSAYFLKGYEYEDVGYTIRIWYYPSSMASAENISFTQDGTYYKASLNPNSFRLYTNCTNSYVTFLDLGCTSSFLFNNTGSAYNSMSIARNYKTGELILRRYNSFQSSKWIVYYWV